MIEHENVRLRIGWIIGMLYLLTSLLSAQNERYTFTDFTVKDGLSHANVLSIYEDKIGSYWVGTIDGLTRILGNEIKNYSYHYSDSTSILSNHVQFVVEDACGQLWVSTSHGVSKYFSNTDSFVPVFVAGNLLKAFSYQLEGQHILFGGNQAIYSYDCSVGEIKPLLLLQSSFPLSINYFKRVDKNRFLVVDNYKGVFWVDAQTGVVTRFPTIHHKTEYNQAFIDSESHLWLAPYTKGLECYSLEDEGKLLHHYTTDNSLLSHNSVTDVKEFGSQLWIATDGGGINILDRKSGFFQHVTHSSFDEHSISSDFIRVLFEDSFGTKWAGTVHNGLICIHEGYMKHYSSVGNCELKGHGYRSVSSICEDQDGNVWMGIEHSGLSKYDIKEKRFTHFPYAFSGSVMSVVDFDTNHLLISFYGEGIYKCHKTTGALTRFILMNPTVDAQMCKSSIGVRMYRSPDHMIQFYGRQFVRYSLNTHQFEQAYFQQGCHPNSLQIISSDVSRTLVHDNQAIYQINHADFSVHILYSDCRNEIKTVTAYGNMLFFYDGQELKIFDNNRVVSSDLKLPYDKKLDVLFCDENGHLWLVFNEAVICHILHNNETYIFTEYDGFQVNSFSSYAKLNSLDGYLYFGGNDGLLQIDKQWFRKKPVVSQPKLFLLAAFVGNKRLKITFHKERASAILPWNYSSMKFQIQIKEREVFRTKDVKYLISGENFWSEVYSNNNQLVLPTLQPGAYCIQATCLLKDGTWTEPQYLISLTILSPWWKTTWFLLLLSVLAVCIISGVVYFIIHFKKRKALEVIHIEKGKLAEEKVNFLINLSYELKTPLTLVYAPLKKMAFELVDDMQKKSIAKVLIQIENMSQLINSIFDVRQMEMGITQVHITASNLNEWVQQLSEDFRDAFELKGIRLQYEFDSSIHILNYDSDKCKIVLSNFLMNALKYSGASDRVLIKTAFIEEKMAVRVSVIDESTGLKDLNTSKFFASFYQGNHSVKGSGLGLAYSKLLMDLQKGSIGCLENEMGGSTFYFDLPLHLVCEIKNCPQGEYMNRLTEDTYTDLTQSVQNYDFGHYTLLLVDDAVDFLDYVQDFLKPYFRKVYTSTSADSAFKQIKKIHPDIVVSDVIMPGKNGFALCHDIKKDLQICHIPVVLLTATDEKEDQIIGYKLGAEACLTKPFDTLMLLAILRSLLHTREVIKEHIMKVNMMDDMPKQCTFSNTDEELLIKLNCFIQENIDNPQLDIDMLSKHMCLSHSSLYTKVKHLTNYSLNDYLMQLRMKKAKEYLVSTNKKIVEIATLVGFGDCRYFSTVFKKYEGVSPSNFKEQFKQSVKQQQVIE